MKLWLGSTALIAFFLAGFGAQATSAETPPYVAETPPYVTIGESTVADGPQTDVPCPNNTCGDRIIAIQYIMQSNVPQGHDYDTGVTKCVNANLRPIAVILGASIGGGSYSTRHLIALCVKNRNRDL